MSFAPRTLPESFGTAEILRANIDCSLEVHDRLLSACLPSMIAAADALAYAFLTGHKAIFFGNGGSAADALHLAAELWKHCGGREPASAGGRRVSAAEGAASGRGGCAGLTAGRAPTPHSATRGWREASGSPARPEAARSRCTELPCPRKAVRP